MVHGSFTPRYLKSKINLRWMQVRQWQMCLSPFGIQMCAMFTCLERIKVSLLMEFPCESKVTQAIVFNQPEWSQFMVFHKSEVISYCSIWTRNFWLKTGKYWMKRIHSSKLFVFYPAFVCYFLTQNLNWIWNMTFVFHSQCYVFARRSK